MTDVPAQAKAAIGRTTVAEDVVAAAAVEALAATLDREGPLLRAGDPLPPLWHGLFCTAKLPRARLGEDGLAKDEPLLPSIPGFSVKLFVGARFRLLRPIAIGDRIRKESAITGFKAKPGRSGALLFAKVEHRISDGAGLAVIEENDIVYRAAQPGGAARPAEPAARRAPASAVPAVWRRVIMPDPILMFRHSAVTFNSHRIHYDRDFARAHGHPGLVVQAMLIARLMLEMVRDEQAAVEVGGFAFRSGQVLYDTAPFTIEGAPARDGRSAELRAVAADGGVALSATAEFKG